MNLVEEAWNAEPSSAHSHAAAVRQTRQAGDKYRWTRITQAVETVTIWFARIDWWFSGEPDATAQCSCVQWSKCQPRLPISTLPRFPLSRDFPLAPPVIFLNLSANLIKYPPHKSPQTDPTVAKHFEQLMLYQDQFHQQGTFYRDYRGWNKIDKHRFKRRLNFNSRFESWKSCFPPY